MTFTQGTDTKVRYEKYGGYVYLLNKRTQQKEKIEDLSVAYLYWLAANGHIHQSSSQINKWLEKGFLTESPDTLKKVFDSNYKDKNSDYCSLPVLATIEVTSKCNLCCKHCGNNSGQAKINELTTRELKILIKEFSDIGLLKLTITGGEALLRSDFWEILSFATEKIPRVTLTSNGRLITEAIAKKLAQGGLAAVKISLDGLDAFHDKNRGKTGTYSRAISAIKNLNNSGIEVRVQSTVMKNNRADLLNLMKITSTLGATVHTFVPVAPIGRASRSLMLSPIEYKHFILEVNRLAQQLKTKTAFEIRPVFGLEEKTNLEVISTKYKCEALKTTLEVTSQGEVIPCSFLPIVIGNIRDNTIRQIWKSKGAQKARGIFDEGKLSGKCQKCAIKKECGGGCRANGLLTSNNYSKGDAYCFRKEELCL